MSTPTSHTTPRGTITVGDHYIDAKPGRHNCRTLRVDAITLRESAEDGADIALTVVSVYDTETGQTTTPNRPNKMTARRLLGRDFRRLEATAPVA